MLLQVLRPKAHVRELAEPEPMVVVGARLARALIEPLAIKAVIAAESTAGHHPKDVSAESRSYGIEGRSADGKLRFIEVKGRVAGARDIFLTQNEVPAALNSLDSWKLAVMEVGNGFARSPVIRERVDLREPGFAETAVVLNIKHLIGARGLAATVA